MPRRRNLKTLIFTLTRQWHMVILALAGGAMVGAGFFEPGRAGSWPTRITLATCLLLSLAEIIRRQRGGETQHPALALQGPLFWTVSTWILYRLLLPFAPQGILLPALFCAWLLFSYPAKTVLLPLTVALGMEIALTLTSNQGPRTLAATLIAIGLTMTALTLLTKGQAYRRRIRQSLARNKKQADYNEVTRDLGLIANGPALGLSLSQFETLEHNGPSSQPTVDMITASFNLQLELIRKTLDLTTVAVLWADQEGRELRLRNLASSRDDIVRGPYPMGEGITGALLRDLNEAMVAPVKQHSPGAPYYRDNRLVGGILALKIPAASTAAANDGRPLSGILCVDRVSEAAWKEEECRILRLATRKLAIDLDMGRQYLTMDRELGDIHRLYMGLRELNRVLGLDQVLDAALETLKSLAHADMCAISLVQDDHHVITRAHGPKATALLDQQYPKEEGLAGQVLKLNRPLPEGAKYPGPAPLFSNDHRFSGFGSILVLPLRKEDNMPIGTIAVAAAKPGVFSKYRRDILEVIAGQVAIKIDLGRAHEQLSKLATTDGLTNLANHRTFQHAFDIMLARGQRRPSPLCLILCDIDHFKGINDSYGHPFGDQILKNVAATLAGTVRKVDLAARYGGEEFAIILEDSDYDGGRLMAERIRQQIAALQLRHNNETVTVTISLGLAIYPNDGEEKTDLIARADKALYQAKQNGRNQVVAWAELPPSARE